MADTTIGPSAGAAAVNGTQDARTGVGSVAEMANGTVSDADAQASQKVDMAKLKEMIQKMQAQREGMSKLLDEAYGSSSSQSKIGHIRAN